ncbi:hypothetical protein [Litorivivens sp.]|uniref:hypothetical protein n=1 Tax=Litorivivens sp. TaxID=2020868 RepID=UPI00356AFD57
MQSSQRERRIGVDSVPESLESYLNASQISTLHKVEHFGWALKYVRRPLFMEPVPILIHQDMGTYAVLEMDGSLNRNVDVALRF